MFYISCHLFDCFTWTCVVHIPFINKLFDNVKNDADFHSIADGDEEISGIGEFSPSLLRSPRSSLSMFILDVILSIKYVYK